MGSQLDRSDILTRVSLAEILTEEIGAPRHGPGDSWWGSVDPALVGTGKSPPTHIYRIDPDGIEYFKDFASGRSGTALDVIMARRGVDFSTALETLAARAGLTTASSLPPPLPRTAKTPPPSRPPTQGFREWVADCASTLWADTAGAGRARQWLQSRGYSDTLLTEWHVGFDAGARSSAAWPKPKRAEHGIANMSGIVFPIFDRHRAITYAQTRNLSWDPSSKYPKYVNPKGVQNPSIGVWSRNEALAGAPIIMVEGPTDALTVRQAGLEAVGLIGAGHAANPATAATLVDTFGTQRPFVVMTDNLTSNGGTDTAGRLAGQWLVTSLWANAASAIYWPRPAAGDISDWLQKRGSDFTGDFAEHITAGLARLSSATQLALSNDQSFIEVAAGGPLETAVAEAWAPKNPLAAKPSPSNRPQRRSATAPELTV